MTGTLVTKDVRGRGVLRVDYVQDMAPNGSQGSMHVQVTSPGGPSNSDRDIVLVLSFNYGPARRQQSVAFRKPMQLPQGARSISTEIPFYYVGAYAWGHVKVLEDGRDIEDSRSSVPVRNVLGSRFYLNGNNNSVVNNVGAILPTEAGFKNFDGQLDQLLVNPNTAGKTTGPLALVGWTNFAQNSEISKRARLATFASDDWRYYYSGDQWFIPLDSLLELKANRPSALDAIRQFIASGGNILVWSPDHEESMREVDRWLDSTEHLAQDFEPADFGWTFSKTPNSGPFDSAESLQRWQNYRVYRKRHLLGNVWVANDTYDPVRDNPIASVAMAPLTAGATRIHPQNDGAWFWRNLIRSVGKPPVWTFCAFVGLFGLVIGPGLLLLTARLGRRSLMILFVPALSALATLLIVFYGIVYEGFSTSIRINGVVAIDQRTGDAFAWSRQNYFSGMPPREGLVFDKQTYVRPVISEDGSPSRYYPNDDEVANYVDLGENKQVWRNWLRARQQQQLLVGHPTQAGLPISIESTSSRQVNLRNLTDEVLPIVIVRGAKDEYFIAEKLGPKADVVCQAQDYDSTAVFAARVRANIRPSTPSELNSSDNSLMRFGRSRRGWAGNSFANDALPDMINVCYEQYLSEHLELPPFGFVTVVNRSGAIEVPLAGELVESSFLIVGTVKW